MSSNDHSTRQVLPLSAAVQGPRFKRRDWERSAQVREILDSFNNLPQTQKPERTVDHSESIIMEGSEILNRLTTGAHVVKQRRISDHLPTLPLELAVEPFEPNTTLQADAATALAAINDRKPFARRTVRPERATATHWATRTIWVWTLLIGSALTAATWLYLALHR